MMIEVRQIHRDWTSIGQRSNCSPFFESLVLEIARLIRDDARSLLAGNAEGSARLILAQLAHVHGLAPERPKT